jgi:hypothetical protein
MLDVKTVNFHGLKKLLVINYEYFVVATLVASTEKLFFMVATLVASAEKLFFVVATLVASAEKLFFAVATLVASTEKLFFVVVILEAGGCFVCSGVHFVRYILPR